MGSLWDCGSVLSSLLLYGGETKGKKRTAKDR